MAKTVTSKNQKTVVADNSTVAATQEAVATEEVAAMENGTVDAEAQKVEATTTETTEIIGTDPDETDGETDPDETDGGNTESGLPFTVGSDGLVEIVSIKRAGKSVCGTTGEIVTFDENGKAKVSIEDALHFQQVPGFDFK
nr:MAG TPA: hypothetical protein [Herelleviridae sp.]